MADFTVHKNRFIDVGFTVFDDAAATPPVVNTSAVATVSCPSGKASVGLVSNDNRKFWIQGVIETFGQPVNVLVSANGKSQTVTVDVLAPLADNRAVVVGSQIGAEYDGPAH